MPLNDSIQQSDSVGKQQHNAESSFVSSISHADWRSLVTGHHTGSHEPNWLPSGKFLLASEKGTSHPEQKQHSHDKPEPQENKQKLEQQEKDRQLKHFENGFDEDSPIHSKGLSRVVDEFNHLLGGGPKVGDKVIANVMRHLTPQEQAEFSKELADGVKGMTPGIGGLIAGLGHHDAIVMNKITERVAAEEQRIADKVRSGMSQADRDQLDRERIDYEKHHSEKSIFGRHKVSPKMKEFQEKVAKAVDQEYSY